MRWCWFAAVLIFSSTVRAAQSDQFAYDERVSVGMAMPAGWTIFDQIPEGWPENDYLFGWSKVVGADAVTVAAMKLRVSAEERGVRIDLAAVAGALKDMMARRGYTVFTEGTRSIGGRPAIALTGGIPSEGGVHGDPASPFTVWNAFFVSEGVIVLIRYDGPYELATIFRPDYESALTALVVGGKPPAPKIPESKVDAKKVEEYEQKRPAVTAGATSQGTPAAAGSRESVILSQDQWAKLQEAAEKQGVSVESLLRKIVDDYLNSRKKDGQAPQKTEQTGG